MGWEVLVGIDIDLTHVQIIQFLLLVLTHWLVWVVVIDVTQLIQGFVLQCFFLSNFVLLNFHGLALAGAKSQVNSVLQFEDAGRIDLDVLNVTDARVLAVYHLFDSRVLSTATWQVHSFGVVR